ncbi:MAG: hypothetical protein U0572_00580 [Phycisphaerales bacterium]
MSRSVWWPHFHDSAYAPPLREELALHWRANVLMLRSPGAVLDFLAIAMPPVVALVAIWWGMEMATGQRSWFVESDRGLLTAFAMLVAFGVIQHLAFVQAMNRTYGPFVRIAMRSQGIDVCLQCGHLLPPSASPERCGECGQPT